MSLSKEGCHKISIARCFGLNRTTLYRWGKRGKTPSLTALQHQIIAVYERSEFTYGTRRIQAELRLQGIIIARSKVRKEMNLLQLTPRYPKPRFYRKSQGVCGEYTESSILYQANQCNMDRRYQLYSHQTRLVISGCGIGFMFA